MLCTTGENNANNSNTLFHLTTAPHSCTHCIHLSHFLRSFTTMSPFIQRSFNDENTMSMFTRQCLEFINESLSNIVVPVLLILILRYQRELMQKYDGAAERNEARQRGESKSGMDRLERHFERLVNSDPNQKELNAGKYQLSDSLLSQSLISYSP
ncbi:hypothetical protein BJ165DRAFT_1512809 [Panaeolus papilionaceus]|nr:hypothetical protein BJ165DRAFT_1512809 [Panaeolus papilionaceus]